MATNTRKLSDFLAEGEGDTFGDLAVVGEPHIKPGTLYPAYKGLLTVNTGHTFTDSSSSARTVTPLGNVQHMGKVSKVGSTSMSFEADADRMEVTDHADFDNGTAGEFTLEFWAYINELDTVANYFFNFGDSILRLSWDVSNSYWYFNAAGNASTSYTTAPTIKTWMHIAIVGTSSTVKVYIDGTERISVARHGSTALNPAMIRIGAYSNGSYSLLGYLDEIRYVVGEAVYTGTFTPPTALTTSGGTYSSTDNVTNPSASQTKFLIHSDAGGNVGAYGTAQSDGHSYYYTDIKGSGPIKDPRIGAHFGSQRHKFKSLQTLEQESGTHGKRVFSIDGRKWARAVGHSQSMINDVNGNYIRFDGNQTTFFYEFVCYCSSLNMILECAPSNRHAEVSIDGGSETSFDTAETTQNSPLKSRSVDAGTLFSVVTGQTLGIHTIKIRAEDGSDRVQIYGIEPVVQDTTSTATKSKIQIPAQTVVSYGKKFSLSAAAHHYDPFNGFTNSSHLHSTYVDTATSLGLDTAPGSSAKWAISNTNNIRPYNGGRVVKWIASDGTIKTSVNMMPPNAQNIGNNNYNGSAGIAAAEIATPSATNVYLPAFSDDVIDNSQAEISRNFRVVEFGNGHANGQTAYRDWTFDAQHDTANTDRAYVMDDGLTSLAGRCRGSYAGMYPDDTNDSWYLTFIGTGMSVEGDTGIAVLAQNLPYGTHIVKMTRAGTTTQSQWVLDGVNITQRWGSTGNNEDHAHGFAFHQPKMPPIPEDACIIADYMLMADFVVQTVGTVGHLSKGVRYVSASRDHFYDAGGGGTLQTVEMDVATGPFGLRSGNNHALASGETGTVKLPYFGTDFLMNHYANRVGTITENLNSDVGTSAAISTSAYEGITKHTGNNLGVNEIKNHMTDGQNDDQIWISQTQIVTPIHTSSHYQTFETPFLYELVGGDRNMEQTNLVVTPDGKTWDEVTRDTSYIGNTVLQANSDAGEFTYSTTVKFDEWRGFNNDISYRHMFNKDFAAGYDKIVCLVDGEYEVTLNALVKTSGNIQHCRVVHNSTGYTTNVVFSVSTNVSGSNEYTAASQSAILFLKRGDYLSVFGGYWGAGDNVYSGLVINRV